jgi:outer membrane lipoprotein-sorting protein
MSEIDEKEIECRFETISQFEPSSEVTARDLERTRKRLAEQTRGKQPREQNIWRIIMKSKITKAAAAAVIIGAVILGLNITSGPDIAGVTWAEVIEKVEQISALTYDMTSEISYPENKKLSIQSENYVAGDYGTKSILYMNGEVFVVTYLLPRKKLAYHIRPKDKTYRRMDMSDEQAARVKEPDDPRTWLKTVLSGDYIELGRDNINGVVVEGIKCSMTEKTGEDTVMRLWVGVETNLPVRIEIEGQKMEGGEMRPHKYVMENFQWDVELDESVFEPNIPEDYRLIDEQKNAQVEQKPPRLLTDTEKDEQPMVREFVRKLFQACSDEDWDEFSTLWPGTPNEMQKTMLGGLEIVHIGEPFKTTDSSKWYVPYEIKLEFGRIMKNNLSIRYDEDTQKYIPRGGL